MSSPADPALSSGVSQPLQPISDNDQSGLVVILAAFSLSIVLTTIPIRTYVRIKIRRYGADDCAFFGAAVFAVFQAISVFYELNKGLGKSEELLDPDDKLSREKAAYSADLLYIITLFLSKCSTAFLFLRLTPSRGHYFAIWGTIYLSTAWMISSTFLIAIRCHTTESWIDISSECTSLFTRWKFIGAVDIITEASLFGISVFLVWGIQMPMASKTMVVGAFGFRLPVVALASLRIHYLNIALHSPDATFAYATPVSYTQIQIGYSILASIVPCLKNFMVAFDRPCDHPAQYHHHVHGMNYKLSPITSDSQVEAISQSNQSSRPNKESWRGGNKGQFRGHLRPEDTLYEAKIVSHGERGSGEQGREHRLDSGNSGQMIIKKGVEWSVDYD